MKDLIVPRKIRKGDTVAFISLSGGRAGDEDMLNRYEIGKKRFQEIFGVKVVETPHALKGSKYLYVHPEKRAEDLMWALQNQEISAIICNMGGDDSYRVLPYIDTQIIHDNPKVFMGYSDIATWMAVFAYAGVRAYYGPNVLTPIAQPGALDDYTEAAIRRTLFETDVIGEVKCSEVYTTIEWRDIKPKKIKWTRNTGYNVIQGQGVKQGRLFPMCGGPLQQIMGTKYFPEPDFFEGAIIAIEHGPAYGSQLAGLHSLRAFAAAGLFDKAVAIIKGKLDEEARNILRKVINEEVHREDMILFENVDFVHHTPMTILPVGVMCEIDCENATFKILESGVRE